MTLYDRVLNTEMDISNSHATSISAFLLFYVIDYVLQSCQWSNKTMRNTYLFIRLRNYSLSIIHAFISGLSSLICLISYPDLVGNVINSENVFAYHIMGFATGYFVHDIYHNICGDVEIRSLEIILHHITVLTCFYVVSRYRILVCYVLLGLLMELNSIFLHARKLMILLNIDPESVAYRVNAIANISKSSGFLF
uniref:TLC domain-containing protein n=1 Tax=Schistosoma mansoni TaxID=6183 RepID=A0A5K4ENY6_SCHMA